MISFIIPVHNAEKTISRAIKSIIGECANTDNEIIVIENGSTDNTVEIVNSLQQQYRSIVLIYSDKGVSKARNAGLKIAKGEWIVFVDADDFLECNVVDVLQKDIDSIDVDFIVYSYKVGNQVRYLTNNENEMFFDENIELCKAKMIENPTWYMQVWSKAFKKEIIDINNLRFNENLCLSEDSDFTLRYLKFCMSICLSKTVFYHYSIDNSSTMRTYNGEKTRQYLIALKETSKSIEDESEYIKNAFNKYVLMHMNIVMVREIYAVDNPLSINKKYKKMVEISRQEIFRNVIHDVKLNDCLCIRMLPILFLKIHCSIFSAIIYLLRAVQNNRKER